MILALAVILALMAGSAAAQANILGPCRQGYRWLATTLGERPVAPYATCREARPLVILACGAGPPELRIAPLPGMVLPAVGQQATALLAIDGAAPLELRLGAARSNEAAKGSGLRAQRTQAAIAALSRGFAARLDARGTIVEMHLGASGDVLRLVAQRG